MEEEFSAIEKISSLASLCNKQVSWRSWREMSKIEKDIKQGNENTKLMRNPMRVNWPNE